MKAYKVVRIINSAWVSLNHSSLPNSFRLTYKMNQETVPDFGGVYCFHVFTLAKMFADRVDCYDIAILSGHGNLHSKQYRTRLRLDPTIGDVYKRYWTEGSSTVSGFYKAYGIPDGTVVLRSFTPTAVECILSR